MDEFDYFKSSQVQIDVLACFLSSKNLNEESDEAWPYRLEQFVKTDDWQAHQEDPNAKENQDEEGWRSILLLHDFVQRLKDRAKFIVIPIDSTSIDEEADPFEALDFLSSRLCFLGEDPFEKPFLW